MRWLPATKPVDSLGCMETPQPGIFREEYDHSYFLEFTLREPAERDALCKALREFCMPASEVCDPEVVLAFGRRAMTVIVPDGVPPELEDFNTIDGPGELRSPSTQSDVLVWIQGSRPDICFEAALAANFAMASLVELSLDLAGFTCRDSRDLIGFVDGSANPKGAGRMDAAVVRSGKGAGGSFVLGQQWVHDLTKWNAVSEAEQEQIVGRTRLDNIEFEGDEMPSDSHVSRTDVQIDGEAMKIWRRSTPYGSVRVHGLYFLAFAKHPARFQAQLDRMYGVSGDGLHDRLTEYSRAATGSYWFAPAIETLKTALG